MLQSSVWGAHHCGRVFGSVVSWCFGLLLLFRVCRLGNVLQLSLFASLQVNKEPLDVVVSFFQHSVVCLSLNPGCSW